MGHGSWAVDDARAWGFADWHAADISFDALTNACDSASAIVHCGGSGSVGYALAHPYQDFHRSCGSLAATLEYARLRAPSTRVVFLSSAAVYGETTDELLNESRPIAPVSPYGVHKALGESLCRMYGVHYGIHFSILRLFSVYGRGLRKQLLWEACNKARQGEFAFSGTGDETRDWIEVTDAARLAVRAIECAKPAGTILNGGTGHAPSVRSVLTELAQCLGSNLTPTFSGSVRPGDPKHLCADISEARSFDWAPTVAWRDGIRKYAEWYLSAPP